MGYVADSIAYLVAASCMSVAAANANAQTAAGFAIEVEAGPVWQSRNNVQIPNSPAGTRFSLVDLGGRGPWPAGRLYVTWNIDNRHSLRLLLAPLSYTETGSFAEPVDFAGEFYQPGQPVEATYKFNSWRVGYRYRFMDRDRLKLSIGFTAKIRDAKIELTQAATTSRDTDVGFVPLLHLGADWRFTRRWHVLFDFDGLAGGPGRAFDAALELGYDLNDRLGIAGGYRTLEGGAEVESVYNFAWFHYAVVSAIYRF